MKNFYSYFFLVVLSSNLNLSAQIPNNIPSNGLVGWWPFNGNANDESGFGNNGTASSTVLSDDRFGNPNSAYYFNGLNSYISVLHSSSIAVTNGTFNAWVKTNSPQEMQILKKSNYSNASGEMFGLTLNHTANNKLDWSVKYNSSCSPGVGWRAVNSPNIFSDGNWHMITTTISAYSISIYVDGLFLLSSSMPNSQIDLCNSPLEFGRNWATNPRWFEGLIDDIGIWNRVLSDNEIYRLYSGSNVIGNVFLDFNQNCLKSNTEVGLNGRTILIQPGNITVQANNNGIWALDSLAAGMYVATVDTTSSNWNSTCSVTQMFSVTNSSGLTDAPDFGFVSAYPCSSPDVSIYAPLLRRCSQHTVPIYVYLCNEISATDILQNQYLDVLLDTSIFQVISATHPFVQIDDTLRFNTGVLSPGQCDNIIIDAFITCEPEIFETVCIQANLHTALPCMLDSLPSVIPSNITPCNLPWDRSSLSVNGWCQNDSVYFSITNNGALGNGDMDCYSEIRIYVDGALYQLDSIRLFGQQSIIFSFAGNGQTWVLQADQHPLHPGNSHPNAHVEACGNAANWTPNLVNSLPLDDADPVIDIYCGQIVGSFDPNDKTGFPNGLTQEHLISPNQQIQYVVRFQNTGNDTAFLVVVRDTLDENLNVFTVTPGVSSHPYTFKIYGSRVLEWTFENIYLPDSFVNEPGSHGFLSYHVEQVPNLSNGTKIYNSAAIYFDQNPPVITNNYFHTISNSDTTAGSDTIDNSNIPSLSIFPNPFSASVTIAIRGTVDFSNLKLEIYSITGQIIHTDINNTDGVFIFDKGNLVSGLYFVSIKRNGKSILNGKLIAK